MNQYGSNNKTFLAPNAIEKVIAPPAVLAVDNTDCAIQLLQAGSLWNRPSPVANPGVEDWNLNGNLIIHRAGLFSNFADGFVFNTPSIRPAIKIWARPFQWLSTIPAGLVSLAHNSKTLLGVGTSFTTDIAPVGPCFKLIMLWGTPALVVEVIDDTTATLAQYGGLITQNAIPSPPSIAYNQANILGNNNDALTVVLPALSNMNQMYDCEKAIPVAALYSGLPRTGFVFFCQVLLNLEPPVTMDFQTVSINPGFAGSTALFDIAVDMEITPR